MPLPEGFGGQGAPHPSLSEFPGRVDRPPSDGSVSVGPVCGLSFCAACQPGAGHERRGGQPGPTLSLASQLLPCAHPRTLSGLLGLLLGALQAGLKHRHCSLSVLGAKVFPPEA